MAKVLMKGNEAFGEGAIQAGCRFYFGYPITPQSELAHFLAKRMPEVGGTFLQAESELASINMVFGAAGAGARAMTSSSGPGISLMQEGISFIACAELPCVIINVMRGGPGLGNIAPVQSDYFQATRGGGHGDYRLIVLAPSSVQEIIDLIRKAFDLAEKYLNPVLMLGDGLLGQMMEPVELNEVKEVSLPPRPWAASGRMGGPKRIINTLYIVPEEAEKHNLKLNQKYKEIEAKEQRWENYQTEDARLVLVAFGTAARVCMGVVDYCREQGLPVGLIRPITLWPFPVKAFDSILSLGTVRYFLSVEMNTGQMIEDIRLAVNGHRPVYFYGRFGGMLPVLTDVVKEVKKLLLEEGP